MEGLRNMEMEGARGRAMEIQRQNYRMSMFREAIGLVLSQWSVLQLAVENEWGGRDSRRKAEEIGPQVFSWFTQSRSKEPLYIDDLEKILDDSLLSLNTEADDGSIEEVAEKLMIIHEECVEDNFSSIESMREASSHRVARHHIRQVADNDDDEDEEDDDDIDDAMGHEKPSDMIVDVPEARSNLNAGRIPANEPRSEVAAEAEDGWTKVTSRRSRGRTN